MSVFTLDVMQGAWASVKMVYMSFRNGVLSLLLSTRMQLSITCLNTLDYFDYLSHGPPHKKARVYSSSTVIHLLVRL